LAVSHVSMKNGARGNGAKHAQYVAGQGRFADRSDVVHIEDCNLPSWALSAEAFFEAADELERGDYTQTRRNKDGKVYQATVRGRAYREVEAAIPREAKDPVKWAKGYARALLGNKHPFRLAIHDREAGDGGRNVHMHLMFSTREMDGCDRPRELFFKRAKTGSYRHSKTKELVPHDPATGGAKKSEFWKSRTAVDFVRAEFERHVQRVAPDFRLARSDAPEPKIGPVLKRAGPNYDRQRRAAEVVVQAVRDLRRQIASIDGEMNALTATGAEHKDDRSQTRWADFERMVLDIGQRDYNVQFGLLTAALSAFASKFEKIASLMVVRGGDDVALARLVVSKLAEQEIACQLARVSRCVDVQPEDQESEGPPV